MNDATRAVRAGRPPAGQGAPLTPSPVFAAPFHLSGMPADAEYSYQRERHPTVVALEEAVGELEDGEVVAFPSGVAAITGLLTAELRAGDVLVAPSDAYPGVRDIAREDLAPRGVEVRLVPTDEAAYRAAVPGATAVWVETPANPRLDVVDVAALAGVAHHAGAWLVVDNTIATPLGQRPLDLGADVSLHSGSKGLTGHGDLVLGTVAVRDPDRAARMRALRTRSGAIVGPFEAWLAHRSLATLAVRVDRSCANALAVAAFLAERDDVADVRHPGLPGDPSHAVAARQMRRFGPIVSFTLPGRDAAEAFLAAAVLVDDATSFGGVHTTAERRARWGTDAVPEGFIRLSAGIEDEADLLADLQQALDAV